MISTLKEPLYSKHDFERGIRNGVLLSSAFLLSRIKHPAIAASIYPASFLAQFVQSYRNYQSKSAEAPARQALLLTSIKHVLYLVPGLRELDSMSRLSSEVGVCFLKWKNCFKNRPTASAKAISTGVLLHGFNLAAQVVWTGKILQMSPVMKSLICSSTQKFAAAAGKK